MQMELPESEIKRLELLARTVRDASSSGEVVRLETVWNDTKEEFAAVAQGAKSLEDIQMLLQGDEAFLYSNRTMVRRYAEAAATASTRDPLRIIAETVRSDSATYPRPTPAQTFLFPPFLLALEEVKAAIEKMRWDAAYEDICCVYTSNGDLYLFSCKHLNQAQAQAMAEWIAVGQQENP
jgi:hypothetical protein